MTSVTLTFTDLTLDQAARIAQIVRDEISQSVGRDYSAVGNAYAGTASDETPAPHSNSPDKFCVQASAAEDRPLASAATHQPETATKSPLKQAAEAVSERTAIMVAPATGVAEAGVSGQPETIPALTGQFPGANVSGLERAGVTAGETAPNSSPATSQGADGHPVPSSDALPAGPLKGAANGKSGHAVTNSPEREPGNPEVCAISLMRSHSGDSRPAAHDPLKSYATSPAGEPIKRERKPLKPHCLRPEMCGGYGRKHCGPCERAAGAQAA